LKHDHRVIQQVVAGMSAVAELLDSGKQVDSSVLADLVQFLRVIKSCRTSAASVATITI